MVFLILFTSFLFFYFLLSWLTFLYLALVIYFILFLNSANIYPICNLFSPLFSFVTFNSTSVFFLSSSSYFGLTFFHLFYILFPIFTFLLSISFLSFHRMNRSFFSFCFLNCHFPRNQKNNNFLYLSLIKKRPKISTSLLIHFVSFNNEVFSGRKYSFVRSFLDLVSFYFVLPTQKFLVLHLFFPHFDRTQIFFSFLPFFFYYYLRPVGDP